MAKGKTSGPGLEAIFNQARPAERSVPICFRPDLRARLQEGIDALAGAGASVALLEVACMRPISVDGAAVPPLPERADDARVAHVNEVFRAVAAANPATTTFVEGPDAWCHDEVTATDVGMRWDGVHVYKPGAKLIFETLQRGADARLLLVQASRRCADAA